MSAFPATRLRRFRRTGALTRSSSARRALDLRDLVYPLFACPGSGVEKPLEGLPGIAQRSVDRLADEAEELHGLGIGAVLLFGIPEEKDEAASGRLRRGRHRPAGAACPARARAGAGAPHRRLPLRVHVARPLRRRRRRRDRQRPLARAAREDRRQPRRGGRTCGLPERHDGRARRRDPRRARLRGLRAGARSSPMRRRPPRPSTGRSARRPSRRRLSGTGAATRWIRPTPARRCASASSTSRKAPTR